MGTSFESVQCDVCNKYTSRPIIMLAMQIAKRDALWKNVYSVGTTENNFRRGFCTWIWNVVC